jgi:hypothetical protein
MDYSLDDFIDTLRGQIQRDEPAENIQRTLNAILPEYRDEALAKAKRQAAPRAPEGQD